ncbi:hypothetical protein ACFY4I_09430 [Streptomyces scabiei]|uniref:hypothetical protein n=1 Tax=Streptomyces scabiei TaxID=1930 RepID=UPI003681585E
MEDTARVIAEVDADILLTVEVEDRLAPDRIDSRVPGGAFGYDPYPFNLLVDGNDSRGIDVGILSRFPVTSVRPQSWWPAISTTPSPLPRSGCCSTLREAMTDESYGANPPGTHGTGKRDEQKLDYLLFSPELWERVTNVGVERRGIRAPRTFPSFDTVTSEADHASDHAALFADLNL